ncbi:MAG TPA: TolC family protein [Gemmatimonadales bacterium]|nr:TolC family protein [Gemmatimonadales bacterium]
MNAATHPVLLGMLLVMATGRAVSAQDTATPLTLAEAARQALETHPGARAAAARLDGAAAGLGEARAARLPSLSIAAAATTYSDPMLVSPLHGFSLAAAPAFDETLIQGGAVARYTLFDGGIRGARIRQARAEVGVGEAALARAEQSLLARVAGAYLEVLLRGRLLDANDRRVAAIEAEHDRVAQLHASGRAALVDVRRAEAALADARAEQTHHRTALPLARRELARLVGERGGEAPLVEVRLRDSAAPDRSAIVAAVLASSPDAEEARRRAAAAEAAAGVLRGARWPSVSLSGGYVNRGGASSDFADEWNAGVELAWPLFTGGAAVRRVDRADAARRAAEEDVRLAELDAAARADVAVADVVEANARLVSLEEAVAAHEAVTAAERLRLETGTGTQADYLSAEADLLGARTELARTRYRRLAAAVELARLMGRLDLTWIESELEQLP